MVNIKIKLSTKEEIHAKLKPSQSIKVDDKNVYVFDPTLIENYVELAEEAAERAELYAQTYIHDQGIASSEWMIEHYLGKFPSVTVIDSANNVITTEVEYINENKVVVRMNGATTGKAYLN